MILLSDSTKIAQAVIFIEKLGTMNWGQFILHIHIENIKYFLVKNQLSDFKKNFATTRTAPVMRF